MRWLMGDMIFRLFWALVLAASIPLGCSINSSNDITWIYVIPEQYEGWVAIQYECEGGEPLEKVNNVIEVQFGEDGMFCTSDSSFAWRGQHFARDTSGNDIPIVYLPSETSGYALCCSQRVGFSHYEGSQLIDLTFDLSWVGDMSQGWPNLDTFEETIRPSR